MTRTGAGSPARGHAHGHPRVAPTALELRPRLGAADVLAVANTRHGPAGHWHARPRADAPDHDHLANPEAAVRWLRDHDVVVPDGLPGGDQLRALGQIRDAVRALADAPAIREGQAARATDPETAWARLQPELRARLEQAAYRVGPTDAIVAAAPAWDGFADDLLLPLLEVLAHAALVRRCANPLCRFTFLDRSRNRSRRWCDPKGCGNRVRVRRHRAATRRRSGDLLE